MKKNLFFAFAVAAIAFTGCKKKEDPTAAAEVGSATVTGTIRADLNRTNDINDAGNYVAGSVLDPVSGMRVYAIVENEDLDLTDNGSTDDYGQQVITGSTNASGVFTLTLPAITNPYTVTIDFQELYTSRITMDQNGVIGDTAAVRVTLASATAEVYDGAAVTLPVSSTSATVNTVMTNPTNSLGSYTMSGVVVVNNEDMEEDTTTLGADSVIWEYVPAGTVLSILVTGAVGGSATNTWVYTTVGTNGTYTATIPTTAGPTGTSTFTIYFPELALTKIDEKASPSVNETDYYTIAGGYAEGNVTNEDPTNCSSTGAGVYAGTATNGATDTDIDFIYTEK